MSARAYPASDPEGCQSCGATDRSVIFIPDLSYPFTLCLPCLAARLNDGTDKGAVIANKAGATCWSCGDVEDLGYCESCYDNAGETPECDDCMATATNHRCDEHIVTTCDTCDDPAVDSWCREHSKPECDECSDTATNFQCEKHAETAAPAVAVAGQATVEVDWS